MSIYAQVNPNRPAIIRCRKVPQHYHHEYCHVEAQSQNVIMDIDTQRNRLMTISAADTTCTAGRWTGQ
jgi:hypothetical protein